MICKHLTLIHYIQDQFNIVCQFSLRQLKMINLSI